MEPPSSINNSKQDIMADSVSDDPSAAKMYPIGDRMSSLFSQSILVVTREFDDESQSSRAVVCAYSALTGLSYIGTTVALVS